MLLQRAGVEQNPGPAKVWMCTVCQIRLRKNTTSVQCTGCEQWCHLKPCSGLKTTKDYSPDFVAACCLSKSLNFEKDTVLHVRSQKPVTVKQLREKRQLASKLAGKYGNKGQSVKQQTGVSTSQQHSQKKVDESGAGSSKRSDTSNARLARNIACSLALDNKKAEYYCSVCQEQIRNNVISVKCNGCHTWCHLRPCSELTTYKKWNSDFLASCCRL